MILDISKTNILGNSSLGIFAISTNKYSLVPLGIKESSVRTISDTLNVEIVKTSIANSVLVGTLVAGNSDTIFLPSNVTQKEIVDISKLENNGTEIIELDSKFTALGNLIVINDKGAIVSDILEKKAQNQIKNALKFEVTVGSLLGSPLVGSIAMCTNRGALVHPLLSEEEIDEISSILRVRTDVCTVNRGIPYPRVGILANSKGAILGGDSTGPESMRAFEVLLAP
jgi:translation initiation factor 6